MFGIAWSVLAESTKVKPYLAQCLKSTGTLKESSSRILFLENPNGFKPQVGTADVLMVTRIGTQEFSMTGNKRSNLHADRKDNGTWRCHITHVETTSESEVHLRVENCWIFLTLTSRKIHPTCEAQQWLRKDERHTQESREQLWRTDNRGLFALDFPSGPSPLRRRLSKLT